MLVSLLSVSSEYLIVDINKPNITTSKYSNDAEKFKKKHRNT